MTGWTPGEGEVSEILVETGRVRYTEQIPAAVVAVAPLTQTTVIVNRTQYAYPASPGTFTTAASCGKIAA